MAESFINTLSLSLLFTVALNPGSFLQLNGVEASRSELANISIMLYTGTTPDEFTSVLIADAVKLLPQINSSRPTVFYFPGWTENPTSESVRTVIGAYLQRRDHNVMLANYAEIVAGLYPYAAFSADQIGSTIARGLNKLVAAGFNSLTLHIVSHSLGSQIAGFVGRNVGFLVPRITGLDPAGPGFYIVIPDLTRNDAKFVDIIHTDAGVLGTAENRGTVNFHPNGGTRPQPGCPLLSVPFISSESGCDHRRSWRYWAESLQNELAFIGVECTSNIAFQSGSCGSNKTVVMGYATPPDSSGDVYLQTNADAAYGRGDVGATYKT